MSSTEKLKNSSVGNHLNKDCHLNVHSNLCGLKSFSPLTVLELLELISLRTGLLNRSEAELEIFLHHEHAVLIRYAQYQ